MAQAAALYGLALKTCRDVARHRFCRLAATSCPASCGVCHGGRALQTLSKLRSPPPPWPPSQPPANPPPPSPPKVPPAAPQLPSVAQWADSASASSEYGSSASSEDFSAFQATGPKRCCHADGQKLPKETGVTPLGCPDLSVCTAHGHRGERSDTDVSLHTAHTDRHPTPTLGAGRRGGGSCGARLGCTSTS